MVRLLGNLKVSQNSSIQYLNSDNFPSNPEKGQLCFKENILYIYSLINNIETWCPITNIKQSYIHIQGSADTTWTITHNMNTTNVVYKVYDNDGNVHESSPLSMGNNSFVLNFLEAISGKCVVFFAKELDTVFKIAEMFIRDTTGTTIKVKGNLIPNSNSTFSLGSPTFKWRSIYLTESTLYVGDELTISSNGINIFSPTSPTNISQQPIFNSSKINLSNFTYNPGTGNTTLGATILYEGTLDIGNDLTNITFNCGNSDTFVVSSSKFNIDSFGNLNISGEINGNIYDGGVW